MPKTIYTTVDGELGEKLDELVKIRGLKKSKLIEDLLRKGMEAESEKIRENQVKLVEIRAEAETEKTEVKDEEENVKGLESKSSEQEKKESFDEWIGRIFFGVSE